MKSSFEGKRAVVTGGCGFIGQHLVRSLASQGASVTVVDDLSTGHESSLDGDSGNIEFLHSQFGEPAVEQVVKEANFLFHLAAVKHYQSLEHHKRCMSVNVVDTQALLEYACLAQHLERVVFTSSLYAYGRWHKPAMSESEVPHPSSLYGIAKLAGERLLDWYHQETGRPYTCFRTFFIYGPGQYYGLGYPSVIYKNFERMLKGEAPLICGDGEQVLDYLYVGDMVRALEAAALSGRGSELLNVGSGQGVSINHLTSLMREIADGPQPVYVEKDRTHGTHREAEIGRIQEALGFQPEVSLTEGLRRTYQWMKSLPS